MTSKTSKLLAFSPAILILSIIFVLAGNQAIKSQISISILKKTDAIATSHFNNELSKKQEPNKYKNVKSHITSNTILALWSLGGLLISILLLFRIKNHAFLLANGAATATTIGAFILWQKVPEIDLSANNDGLGFLPESHTDFELAMNFFGMQLSETSLTIVLTAIPVLIIALVLWRLRSR